MAGRDDVVRLDAERLKAIAHPLRARILAALRIDGPATSSILAQRFATNTGQTSYHLRVLGDAGLVEEDHARGTRRERWWRSAHRSNQIEARDFVGDPGAMERVRWLRAEAARLQDRAYTAFLDESHRYGADWEATAGMSDWVLHLTVDELDTLQRELAAVVERWVGRARSAETQATGGEPVHVHVRAFPHRDLDLS